MNNVEQIINDLKGIFTKTQLKEVSIEYSESYGGQIEIRTSDKVFNILDNENSKLFAKFKEVVYDKYDLDYAFKGCGYIEIYED